MYALLDLRDNHPSFIYISGGKLHDFNGLDLMIPEQTAIYVIDRAYLDLEQIFGLLEAGALFVSRQIECRSATGLLCSERSGPGH